MLQNAVHPLAELHQVKLTADQNKVAGVALTYDNYFKLLYSTAVNYDESFTYKSPACRSMLVHDVVPADDGDLPYDIDTGIDTVLANVAACSSLGARIPASQWFELSSEAQDLCQSFPEADRAIILGTFPNSGQPSTPHMPKPSCNVQPSLGLGTNGKQHSGYLLEIAIEDEDPISVPPSTEAPPPASPPGSNTTLLANVTKQKCTWTQPRGSDLPPSNIRKVLSTDNSHKDTQPHPSHQHELVIDGTRYHAVNVACIYTISSMHCTTVSGSLIDHGANGGIAGDDVQIIKHTMRTIDVCGIDNHEVTGIPIVTAGGVVKTRHGPVIAILPQYAYLGSGKTIHSATQLEYYQNDVNDQSIKVAGGLQCILTLDGYIIPINIVGGLPYISMRPYMDDEWENLPQVILTSDLDWDPTVLDHTHNDSEHWYDALCDLDERPYESKFDPEGHYLGRVVVQTAILPFEPPTDPLLMVDGTPQMTACPHPSSLPVTLDDSPSLFVDASATLFDADIGDDIIDRCVYYTQLASATYSVHPAMTAVSASHPHTITDTEPDYEALHPYFGWLPLEMVKATFARTTQYAQMPMSTYLKCHFKSLYPALNVHHCNEPVATDTVYSDTPAIAGGETYAQLFVGTESLVTDVEGMKTDKQFVNTLEDNIHHHGAPTKLILDRAQVEISNKVKDILCALCISDWQSEPFQQHQNAAEHRYQTVKSITNTILDRTGSPPPFGSFA